MGLYSFVLFAAIVLLACVGSASKVAAANSTAQGRGDAEEQNGTSTKSFARTSEPTDEGDEARGLMGKASVSHIPEPMRVRFWAMLGRPDKSIRVRLMSQMRKLYEKLATTDTNHFGHSNAEGAVKAYLEGTEGAQLAKIASQLRNENPEMHNTFLKEAVKRLDLTRDKDGALMRTLASFRHFGNEEMQTLATELLRERIRLLAGGEKPFDAVFALIKSGAPTISIFAGEEKTILNMFIRLHQLQNDRVNLLDIFVKYFGDEATLLKALAEAKKLKMSSKNAQEIEGLLLEKWANTGVELKVVLQQLHGGQPVNDLKSQAVDIAVKYIDLLNKKRPDSKFFPVAFLTDIYGDAVVTESLIELQQSLGLGQTVKQLQEEQLKNWLRDNTPVAEVLTRMEVKDNEYVFEKLYLLKQYLERYRMGQSAKHSTGLSKNAADDFLADSVFALAIAKWKDILEDEQLDQLLEFVFSRWSSKHSTAQNVENLLRKDVSRDNDAVEFLVSKYSSFYNSKHGYLLPDVTPRRT